MSTEFFNDQWRIPSNENQNKISNYSMGFNSVTFSKIEFGNINNFERTDAFSGSCWFYHRGNSSQNAYIISKFNTKGYQFYINSGGAVNLVISDGSIMQVAVNAPSVFEWNHLVFTYDGSSLRTGINIYVNGKLQTPFLAGVAEIFGSITTTAPFQISGRNGTTANGLNGDIDQVTIFDYELSQDQVTQIGAEGYAFNFDGVLQSGDYIDCGIGSRFNLSQITISTWIKKNSSTINYAIAAGIRNNTGPIPYFISLFTAASNQIRFVMAQSDGTNITTLSNAIIQNDIWYHVVGVADGSNVLIYVNGDLQTDQKTYDGTILTPNENFNIGRQAPSGGVYYWDGELSNISVFNTGLQDTDVQTLYNSGKPGNISSLNPIGWWKLDDTATFNSGTSVWSIPDASTNSNTGASFGMNASSLVASNIEGELISNPMALSPKPINYYQLGDQSVSTGPSADYLVPNNSLSDYVFNFSSDIINTSPTIARQQNISYSLWINTTSLTNQQYIVGNLQGSDNGTGIFINNNYLHFQIAKPGNGSASYFGSRVGNLSSYVSVNEWFHVAASWDGTDSKIYINGVLPVNPTWTPTSPHIIGGWGNFIIGDGAITSPSYYSGKLSNVAYWDDALTDPQVATLYNNGAPGNISSLNPAGWWKLNASEIFNSTSTEWSIDNNAYPSVYQSSLDFNGSSLIDCSNDSSLQITGAMTVSYWFQGQSADTSATGVGKLGNNGSRGFALGRTNGNDIYFFIAPTATSLIYARASIALSNTQWYHLAAVYTPSTSLVIYLDGEPLTSTLTGSVPASQYNGSNSFEIGNRGDSGKSFIGEISNVSIFNTALSTPNVQTLYNNGTPEASISHSPVSWWKLDNTTTGLIDNGSASNNGTNNGAAEYAGFVNALAGESVGMDSSNLVVSDLQQTSGYSPYALDFDGADDYLTMTSTDFKGSGGTVSYSFWVKPATYSGSSNYGYFLSSSSNGGGIAYSEGGTTIGTTPGQMYLYNMTNAGAVVTTTSTFIDENVWNHIVVVFNTGNEVEFYKNGILSSTLTGITSFNSTWDTIAARRYPGGVGNYVNGELSNFSIFDTALTSTEVTEVYNQGVPSNLNTFSGTAPVAWWQLGSNSSFNTNWTCLDEIGTNNAVSANMTNDAITNGPGYSANGLGSSTIDIVGDAPYSTANGLSENMDVLDRVSGTGNVPG